MSATKAAQGDGAPSAERLWLACVILLPVLCNLHLLLQLLSAAPIYLYSGLATAYVQLSAVHPTLDFNVGSLSEAQGRLAALDIFAGIMPWWNPYEGVGTPLAGNMQSAALFPPSLLLALPDGTLYMHVLLQSVAGLFTYLFMRRLGISPLAAGTAAVLFEFNGTLAWLPTSPIAFLPMLLYAVEREITQAPGAWRWIALAVTLSLYAGFPEMAYIDGLLVAIWTIARLACLPGAQMRASALRIAGGVACGILLAAPILIAFADDLAIAFYSLHANGFLGHQHLPRVFAVHPALPYLFGPEQTALDAHALHVFYEWGTVGGYTGVGLLTLGLFGLAGRRHRALRLGLALWLIFCIIGAYGLPGAHVLIWATMLYNAAFFRYFDPSFIMALAVLAGLALDDMREGPTRLKHGLAVGAVTLYLALGIWAVRDDLATLHKPLWVALSLAWAMAILGGLLLGGFLSPPRFRRIAMLLVTAEALFNFTMPTMQNPRHPALALGSIAFLREHLGLQRVYAMGPLEPNYGSYFGIAQIDDCDFPLPANWFTYRQTHLDPYAGPLLFDGRARQPFIANAQPPALEFAQRLSAYEDTGVRYLLLHPGTPIPGGLNLPKVYEDVATSIYELPNPRPYFTAPDCVISAANRNKLTVDCAAPSTLTRLELAMPGWRAEVNGRAVPLSTTGEIFQQIALPQGGAKISFSFRPPHMKRGYAAFFAGLLLLCLPFSRRWRVR